MKLVGAYVPDETHKALKAKAKKKEMPVTDLLRAMIAEYLDKG